MSDTRSFGGVQFIAVSDAADMFGIPAQDLTSACERGHITSERIRSRLYLSKRSLERHIAELLHEELHRVPMPASAPSPADVIDRRLIEHQDTVPMVRLNTLPILYTGMYGALAALAVLFVISADSSIAINQHADITAMIQHVSVPSSAFVAAAADGVTVSSNAIVGFLRNVVVGIHTVMGT